MNMTDLVTGIFGLVFTLLVLSYIVGDNPAFRLAIHAFIGIAAGYVAAIVLQQVILGKILAPLASGLVSGVVTPDTVVAGASFILGLVLLAKIFPRTEWVARPIVAGLVGTGAAAAVAGAQQAAAAEPARPHPAAAAVAMARVRAPCRVASTNSPLTVSSRATAPRGQIWNPAVGIPVSPTASKK